MDSVEYKHLNPMFGAKLTQIELLAAKILRFIPRSIPEYPSHGVDHSIQIIEHLDSFIDNWHLALSDEEIYLLYLGSWLHDIGNIVDRDEHHIHSMNFIEKSQIIESQLGMTTKSQLEWLVKGHSSKCDIKDVPIDLDKIRLRFITAVFRIVDACEIINTKCPMEVYQLIEKTMPQNNKIYWEAHRSILGIKFNNPKISFYVNDKEKSQILTSHVVEEILLVKKVLSSNKVIVPKVNVIVATKPY